MTGLHIVADIHCTSCNQVLGWKNVSDLKRRPHLMRTAQPHTLITLPRLPAAAQEHAYEESQKYKEGK